MIWLIVYNYTLKGKKVNREENTKRNASNLSLLGKCIETVTSPERNPFGG
jgi:hypothetical protein